MIIREQIGKLNCWRLVLRSSILQAFAREFYKASMRGRIALCVPERNLARRILPEFLSVLAGLAGAGIHPAGDKRCDRLGSLSAGNRGRIGKLSGFVVLDDVVVSACERNGWLPPGFFNPIHVRGRLVLGLLEIAAVRKSFG